MHRTLALLISVTLGVAATDAAAHGGTLIVSVDGAADTVAALGAAAERSGGSVRFCSPATRLCVLDFAGDPPVELLADLAGVQYVERDRPLRLMPTPGPFEPPQPRPLDDVRFADYYGTEACPAATELELMRVDEVWEQGLDGTAAPVVAVVDLGFAGGHSDLAGRIAGQYDYGDLDDEAEVQPLVALPHHGTFMAGLIAAAPDNDLGRIGIAPFGQLFLQRVCDSASNQDLSFTIHALSDIADNHPEVGVVAYSLIPSVISTAYEQAVEALGDAGVLFVAAAGNCLYPDCAEADNDANPLYPMSYPFEHIVVVASTDNEDGLNRWTHYGAESVDLFAPGVDLCSLDIVDSSATRIGSGTSYAAPLVAGAAALVLEAHPDLRPTDLARLLRATVEPLPALAHMVRSGGRLDVAAAVAAAVPWIAWPPDVTVADEQDLLLSPLSNYGAVGEATVVIFHGPEVAMELVDDGFDGHAFEAGETIELPDAGELEATSPGLILSGRLEEHTDAALRIHLRGVLLGSSRATVRMTLVSTEGTLLGAPYHNEGSATDASGFEAHPFAIEVTSVAGEDPGDTGPTDGGPQDGGADADSGDADASGDADPADSADSGDSGDGTQRGCDCSAAASPSPRLRLQRWLAAALRI